MHTRHPSGFRPSAAQLPHLPYKQPVGAVVHTWRPGHWYTWMLEVNGSTISEGSLPSRENGSSPLAMEAAIVNRAAPQGTEAIPEGSVRFTFGRGGNQGGEGNDQAAEWWIENVRAPRPLI